MAEILANTIDQLEAPRPSLSSQDYLSQKVEMILAVNGLSDNQFQQGYCDVYNAAYGSTRMHLIPDEQTPGKLVVREITSEPRDPARNEVAVDAAADYTVAMVTKKRLVASAARMNTIVADQTYRELVQ